MGRLYQKITEYTQSDAYAFHMPGHKRQDRFGSMSSYDLTEIPGFDDLHEPEEILLELTKSVCDAYQCEEAWISLNGSTGAILTAISAATSFGDMVLVARNCHKSVYHAMEICGLRPVYLYPEKFNFQRKKGEKIQQNVENSVENSLDWGIMGNISPKNIESALSTNPEIRCVILTSPTYEGVISDIEAIAEIVHRHGGVLIVDAAHGAHLGFSKAWAGNPLQLGADLVVMSLHKTLPAVTQTAVLCLKGNRISKERLWHYYDIYLSSSPSYPMLCSVEHCMETLLSDEVEVIFSEYEKRLIRFYAAVQDLSEIVVVNPYEGMKVNSCESLNQMEFDQGLNQMEFDQDLNQMKFDQGLNQMKFDQGKILIGCKSSKYDGVYLEKILREKYRLQMEMVSSRYVLAMTSICDTDEGFARLEAALKEIDAKLCTKVDSEGERTEGCERELIEVGERNSIEVDERNSTEVGESDRTSATGDIFGKAEVIYTLFEAEQKRNRGEYEVVDLFEAEGRISSEYVMAYPPGIPILAPGERIQRTQLQEIEKLQKGSLRIVGLKGSRVEVLCEGVV